MVISNWAIANQEPKENIVKSDFKIIFPIKGVRKDFTGYTKNTAPNAPGVYIIAKESDWYYEWPTPTPSFSYNKYKGEAKVNQNQEPGYYACRSTLLLPTGCGRPHQGVDIYAHYGTPIIAPESGNIVSYSGKDVFAPAGTESKNGGSGRLITLIGDSGYTYIFMHTMGFSEAIAKLARASKDFGNIEKKETLVPVNAGDIIGYVGRTGGIINPHLHFQILINGTAVDPNLLL